MIKILMCCHGNICRSTMAQSVMAYLVKEAGLERDFEIDSAGTSREETGNPVHHGTRRKLQQESIPLIPHRARQMTKEDCRYYDLLIGMDQWNIHNMERIAGKEYGNKIHLLLSYAGRQEDIADPWYTGNFDETFSDVMEGCTALLNTLK